MTVQNDTTLRNGYGSTWQSNVGASPKIRIYSGAPPTNCAAAASGTLLAEFALGATPWSTPASGAFSLVIGGGISTTGLATNTAGHYRIVNNAGSLCLEQGTVTATGGGGDATIDNTSIVTGQQVNITGWSKTYAGA
jgi:hypothetical protein